MMVLATTLWRPDLEQRSHSELDIKERVKLTQPAWCVASSMYTIRPKNLDKYSQIQICPWFLKYSMAQKEQFQGAQNDVPKLAAALEKWLKDNVYTAFDFMGLFDKVLLHEVRRPLR